jgi:hypothetical protein
MRISRSEWEPSLLRELWIPLLKMAPYRKLMAEYEARWWNLAGFFLRSGYGYPLDDFPFIQKILAAYPHDHLREWLMEEKELTPSEQEQIFGINCQQV